MQKKRNKKLLVLVVGLLIISIVVINFVPVNRVVAYKLYLKSLPLVVFKELNNPEKFKNWYADSSAMNAFDFKVESSRDSMTVSYTSTMSGDPESSGKFKISLNPDGNTLLVHEEDLKILSLTDKIKYLFSHESFRKNYAEKVERLKNFLETPRWESAGMNFVPSIIPNQFIAAFGDTIRPGTAEIQFMNYYNKILSSMDTSSFLNLSRPQSRYKVSEGTGMYFQVGLELKDSLIKVPAPLSKLEVPSVKMIAGGFKGKYEDLPDALEIMKDWIKKNNLVTASHPWIEHKILLNGNQRLLTDSMYVIQPVYFYPEK
jgi:hypothetical protein